MSDLASLGITVQRSFHTGSTEVGGVGAGSTEVTEMAFTLPATADVHAGFSKEGRGKRLVKIFKKELQTGDAAFDNAVYVSTDTTDTTKQLLASEAVRQVIARIVVGGGHVEIDGAFVTLRVPGHHETEDADAMTIVQALVAK